MAIAGPRLDRPSAVGTEGRPRAASLTVAAVVVAGLAVATLVALRSLAALALLGTAVTLTVIGLALVTRDRFGPLVVGHLCFHPGAALLGLSLLGLLSATEGLVLAGYLLALLGVAGTWANVFERDRLSAAVRAVPVSYVATLLWIVVIVFAVVFALGTVSFVTSQTDTTSAGSAFFGFLLAVAMAAGLVRAAIETLPILALAPEADRSRWERHVDRARRGTTVVAVGAIGATVLVGLVLGPTGVDGLAGAYPALDVALSGLASPVVLGAVAVVGVAALLAAAAGLGAREVATHVDRGNYGLLAGTLAGFVLGLLLTLYLYVPVAALFYPGLVGIAVLSPLLVVGVGYAAVAAMDSGFLPDRAGGPALASIGLLVAAVGAALVDLPGPLVFGPVAGAVLVWDLSTFGLGVTVELGHRPDTRHLELYHGVLSVGVGVAAVVAATGLDWLRRTLGDGVGAWPAVASAVLGAVVLVVALYRRRP